MAKGFQSLRRLQRKCSLLFRGVSELCFDLEQAKKFYGEWFVQALQNSVDRLSSVVLNSSRKLVAKAMRQNVSFPRYASMKSKGYSI